LLVRQRLSRSILIVGTFFIDRAKCFIKFYKQVALWQAKHYAIHTSYRFIEYYVNEIKCSHAYNNPFHANSIQEGYEVNWFICSPSIWCCGACLSNNYKAVESNASSYFDSLYLLSCGGFQSRKWKLVIYTMHLSLNLIS